MALRRDVGLALGSVVLIVSAACGGGAAPATPVAQAPVAPAAKPANAAQPAAAAKVATASARGTDSAVAVSATRDAAGATRAQQGATATSVAQARAAAAAETARPAPTPVLPPGLNPLAGATEDTSSAVPLSSNGEGFVLLRENPQLVTDDMLLQWLTTQIRYEAGAWQAVDCFRKLEQQCVNSQVFPPARPNPARPTFVFEWQKAIEQTPDLARGPLLDVFIRPDADWSFVKREAEWDDNNANFVQVFLFSRESVEGRQPDFAAQELLPVFRRHFEAVIARAPSTFWFNAPINLKYDFATGTFRGSLPSGNIDLLNSAPLTGSAPSTNGYLSVGDLPESVRDRANYTLALAQPAGMAIPTDSTGVHLPGLVLRLKEDLLPPLWQAGFGQLLAGQTAGATRIPPMLVLSMDRQLQIPPIAMDAARAEALTKKMNAGSAVRAKVYMTFEHALTFNWGSGASSRGQQAVLTARVLKVELVLTPNQQGNLVTSQDEALGSYSP